MVERELQRQKMLREMGFAVWVAQAPLPGAITSPVLGEKPSPAKPTAATQQPAATTPAATAQPSATGSQESPQALLAQVRAGLGGGRKREPAAPAATATAEPTSAAHTTPEQRTPMRFTLQVLPMSFGYLMVQQKDPSAPSFNREEQRLLQGFAALWGGYHGMPRTFACPLGRQPMDEHDAKEAITGYLSALGETWQAPHNKVLVLAQQNVAELMVAQRYVAHPLHDGQLLVVSSLAEMLQEPLAHKKASWQAIMEAGYYAAAQHS